MSIFQKDKTTLPSLIILGIAIIFFCLFTFDFPKNTPIDTPFPTTDARTINLKDNLLSPDDFTTQCCTYSYYVELGNQHDGLPSQSFVDQLSYGTHTFENYGNPIRIFTYEIISKAEYSDYIPEGYLVIFIYATKNEAQNIYGDGQNDIPGFDKAFFHDGYPYDWASGRFLSCRVIANIYIEGYSSDNLDFLSRDISSRTGYLC